MSPRDCAECTALQDTAVRVGDYRQPDSGATDSPVGGDASQRAAEAHQAVDDRGDSYSRNSLFITGFDSSIRVSLAVRDPRPHGFDSRESASSTPATIASTKMMAFQLIEDSAPSTV